MKLYAQQSAYLYGIARLHMPALSEYMDAHAEHVTLEIDATFTGWDTTEGRIDALRALVREYCA